MAELYNTLSETFKRWGSVLGIDKEENKEANKNHSLTDIDEEDDGVELQEDNLGNEVYIVRSQSKNNKEVVVGVTPISDFYLERGINLKPELSREQYAKYIIEHGLIGGKIINIDDTRRGVISTFIIDDDNNLIGKYQDNGNKFVVEARGEQYEVIYSQMSKKELLDFIEKRNKKENGFVDSKIGDKVALNFDVLYEQNFLQSQGQSKSLHM